MIIEYIIRFENSKVNIARIDYKKTAYALAHEIANKENRIIELIEIHTDCKVTTKIIPAWEDKKWK